MADNYDRYENEGSGGFMMGLLTGTVLGAGLGMLLAPRAGKELRDQIGEQAKNLGSMANDQYKKASETATTWAERGREFMDRARDAVQRGAEETKQYGSGTTGSSYGSGASGSSPSSSGTSGTYGSGSAGSTGSGSSFGKSGGDFGRS